MVPDEGNILAGRLTTDLDRSFERLMTTYWHQLYAFVLRRTANAQDAEDIVSEVFVRSYIALKGYPVERIRLLKITLVAIQTLPITSTVDTSANPPPPQHH